MANLSVAPVEQSSPKRLKYDTTFSSDLLKIYYANGFPYEDMVKWVGRDKLPYREWCFVLKDDIFCRYQSFTSAEDFKKKVLDAVPHRMETGCCFSHFPKQKDCVRAEAFYPTERDLVFDIDMDEYDDIRTCCTGAEVCEKCCVFIKAAMVILKTTLEEDFGFTKMFFVFSGRRGMHCWVYDDVARKLTNEQRGAVAEYIQVLNEARNGIKTCKLEHKGSDSLHLVFHRAAHILGSKYMDEVMEQQRPYDGKEDNLHVKNLTQMFNDAGLKPLFESLVKQIKENEPNVSVKIWELVKKLEREKKQDREKIGYIMKEMILMFTYPRLDIAVSKTMNHLLKIPFCVHPKTGCFCVPIFDPENFSFSDVPTLAQYADEFERTGTSESLRPYLQGFSRRLELN
eukprot:GEMP01039612.1.p1 GENE.GEMP01039612.1~~GEMP01039612.1.p1  ORF type:complete len:415 (+),score=90.09 GEMP01039612.1:50-1246(+)